MMGAFKMDLPELLKKSERLGRYNKYFSIPIENK